MSEQKHNSFVNVTVIKDDAVYENHLFIGDHKEICELAEKKFLDLFKQESWNWDDYTPDDIEAILEDGLAEFRDGTICITWPEISFSSSHITY